MLMGSGANFVLPTALAEQIPFFEKHLPEGLCIATFMNASTAVGSSFAFVYLYFKSIGYVIPFSISVPTLLVGSCVVSFLAAAVFNLTVDGVSLFLFLCCALSGAIGSISAVIMNPFMSNFESNYISAGRVGSSAAQVLCALLAVIQQPGSAHLLFSTAVYLVCFGAYFTLPIAAYWIITRDGIGKKEHRTPKPLPLSVQSGKIHSASEREREMEIPTLADAGAGIDDGDDGSCNCNNARRDSGNNNNSDDDGDGDGDGINAVVVSNPLIRKDRGAGGQGQGQDHGVEVEVEVEVDSEEGEGGDIEQQRQQGKTTATPKYTDNSEKEVKVSSAAAVTAPGLRNTNSTTSWLSAAFHDGFVSGFLCRYVIPRAWLLRRPWLANVLPYMMTIAWINFNTWGMLSAVYPFAVQYSTISHSGGSGGEVSQNSAENLSIAFQVAAVCLVAGDFSTTKLRLPFDICLCVFTTFVLVIYLAATNLVPSLFQTPAAAPLIVSIFCLGRFLEAHMVTTTYRVAGLYPLEQREEVSMAIGAADQLFTVIGAIFSTILVSEISSCK